MKSLFILLLTFSLISEAGESLETRVKIGVIDSGLNVTDQIKPFLCRYGHRSFVGQEPLIDQTAHQHGTNVAGLIADNLDPKKHCLVIIKIFSSSGDNSLFIAEQGLTYALTQNLSFLNLSLGGDVPDPKELVLIKKALSTGMKISTAAGNNGAFDYELSGRGNLLYKNTDFERKNPLRLPAGKNLDKGCTYFPACYNLTSKNFHVVGSSTGYINQWGGVHIYGNYGKKVKYYEDGTLVGTPKNLGTSQSTAIHTGKWASGKIK